LVLQMVTEGNLTLEDTLAAHLPGEIADNIPNSNQITIRQMLNMTSGIAEYRDNPDFWTAVNNKTTRGWSPFDLIAYAYPLEPTFAPGEGVAYSNTNYLLLQLILGTVLEDPLAEEMRDRILDPLNMQETFFEPIGETTGAHVPGYADVNGDGNVESFAPYDDGRGLGDLGLISAALDLGKFAPALYNRTLPGENGRSESLATNPLPNGDEYGLGIMKRDTEWGALWGYNGRTTGFVTQMWYLPAYDLTVIVLINHETPELADKLVQDALSAAIVIEGE
ncbi:MAG: beta-lactamase family protein, partial [Chloroflexi bacterium]|nr:beta-lactamase family protein [Chloroflexota bacterium]